MLDTSGFMYDVTFGYSGPYGDPWSGVAIRGRSLMCKNALFRFVRRLFCLDSISTFLHKLHANNLFVCLVIETLQQDKINDPRLYED